MGKMRGGGRNPTSAETALMAEARETLAEMCGEMSPKDIVGREAIGNVIEELGINSHLKERSLGFRGMGMSISQKVLFSKMRMEEPKKFTTPATYTSQSVQTNVGGYSENRGSSNAVRILPSDRLIHGAVSSGGTPVSSHVTAAGSTLLQHQLPTGDVKMATMSTGLPSGHLGDSSSFAYPRQAIHSPMLPLGLCKLNLQHLMTPQAVRDQTFRPFNTQTAAGTFPSVHQPAQGVNFTQAPPFTNHHTEIARIVQKLLQPKLPAHLTWTPPSREYMNKAGEWHCARCLSFCNGKPLPPKYGRVMRSINVPKVPACSTEAQSSSEKKVENLGPLLNHEKVTANGSSALQTPVLSTTVNCNSIGSASGSKVPKGNSTKPLEAVRDSPSVGRVNEKPEEHSQMTESSNHEEKKDHTTLSQPADTSCNTISDKADHSQPSHNKQDILTEQQNCAEIPSNNCHDESSGIKYLEKGLKGDIDCIKQINQSEQDAANAQVNPTGNSGTHTVIPRHPEFSCDGLCAVEWDGDVLQVVDEKEFYRSCCINGITYEVHDHALIHFGQDKLIPSKLQAMWEDAKTGIKWVVVKRCYFPNDLPEGVVYPCAPETSEVYESNNDSTVMATSIQCPCEVLPAAKFKEESERRNQLETESTEGLRAIFLCKWLYDEFQVSFQRISS
ncbi:RING/FYVE/PHD zinc finger superfamily protein, putative isoform 2 [Hibiscus syriacus]|uniref:RING/FYVE/PHD zinc finger superfamily protein, putative isoform 2 n=1 Tax=Hibiscus syriacus TaxID=106335 RepID=A0A6A2WYB7_HIBSY|nr:RING/FYVE/PHD zinc finger superfamily protein, putative isoform 2 [Hibiscus syriacus]